MESFSFPTYCVSKDVSPPPRLRSPSSRAPWPFACPEDNSSGASPRTSPPPAEALAVLWRDGSSSPQGGGGGVGAGAGRGQGGGGGAAGSFDGEGARGSAPALRGGGGVGDSRTRGAVAAVGNGTPPGGGRRNAVLPLAERGGEVVVILREDARVPMGHIADAAGGGLVAAGVAAAAEGGGRLCERAGLTLLRRVARVRVLSAAESATSLPRCVHTGRRLKEGSSCWPSGG